MGTNLLRLTERDYTEALSQGKCVVMYDYREFKDQLIFLKMDDYGAVFELIIKGLEYGANIKKVLEEVSHYERRNPRSIDKEKAISIVDRYKRMFYIRSSLASKERMNDIFSDRKNTYTKILDIRVTEKIESFWKYDQVILNSENISQLESVIKEALGIRENFETCSAVEYLLWERETKESKYYLRIEDVGGVYKLNTIKVDLLGKASIKYENVIFENGEFRVGEQSKEIRPTNDVVERRERVEDGLNYINLMIKLYMRRMKEHQEKFGLTRQIYKIDHIFNICFVDTGFLRALCDNSIIHAENPIEDLLKLTYKGYDAEKGESQICNLFIEMLKVDLTINRNKYIYMERDDESRAIVNIMEKALKEKADLNYAIVQVINELQITVSEIDEAVQNIKDKLQQKFSQQIFIWNGDGVNLIDNVSISLEEYIKTILSFEEECYMKTIAECFVLRNGTAEYGQMRVERKENPIKYQSVSTQDNISEDEDYMSEEEIELKMRRRRNSNIRNNYR